jgi:hypothetical protein
MVVDSSSNLYAADVTCKVVWKYNAVAKYLSVYAGTISSGTYNGDGPATSYKLDTLTGLTVDSADNVYIASTNGRIQKVDLRGMMTTLLVTNEVYKMVWNADSTVLYFTQYSGGDRSLWALYPNDMIDEVDAAVVTAAATPVYTTPFGVSYTFDDTVSKIQVFSDATVALSNGDATFALWADLASLAHLCTVLTVGKTFTSAANSATVTIEPDAVTGAVLLRYVDWDGGGANKCLNSYATVTGVFTPLGGTNGPAHIAFVRMLTTGKGYFYLNGVLLDTTSVYASGGCYLPANNVAIGGDPFGANDLVKKTCSGTIHDAAVYKGVLSGGQIQEHMYSTIKPGGPTQGPTPVPSGVPTAKPVYRFTNSPFGTSDVRLFGLCVLVSCLQCVGQCGTV